MLGRSLLEPDGFYLIHKRHGPRPSRAKSYVVTCYSGTHCLFMPDHWHATVKGVSG